MSAEIMQSSGSKFELDLCLKNSKGPPQIMGNTCVKYPKVQVYPENPITSFNLSNICIMTDTDFIYLVCRFFIFRPLCEFGWNIQLSFFHKYLITSKKVGSSVLPCVAGNTVPPMGSTPLVCSGYHFPHPNVLLTHMYKPAHSYISKGSHYFCCIEKKR